MSSSVLAAGMMAAVLILSGCANWQLLQARQALTEAQVAECEALAVGTPERSACFQRLMASLDANAAAERELFRAVVEELREDEAEE